MSKPTHDELLAALAVIEAAEKEASDAPVSDTTSEGANVSTPAVPDLATTKVQGPHLVTYKGFLGPVWVKH